MGFPIDTFLNTFWGEITSFIRPYVFIIDCWLGMSFYERVSADERGESCDLIVENVLLS
jgi:hypothetical protein